MNYGLITSFVVAGILLLSILSMNQNVSVSSTEITMRQIIQQRTYDIADMLKHDISKIGYNESGVSPHAIDSAESNKVKFTSNIDNTGTSEAVTWEFTDEDVSSPNPYDKVLLRQVDSKVTKVTSGVTKFHITYLDENQDSLLSPQDNLEKIKHIKISLMLQSPEKVGKNNGFITTNWNRTLTPINLNLSNLNN